MMAVVLSYSSSSSPLFVKGIYKHPQKGNKDRLDPSYPIPSPHTLAVIGGSHPNHYIHAPKPTTYENFHSLREILEKKKRGPGRADF